MLLFYQWLGFPSPVSQPWCIMVPVQDKSLGYCNHSSIKWTPLTTPTIWQGASYQTGAEMGHSGVCSRGICCFCHSFGDEGLKKQRYVLSFLKALTAFAVSSWVCSPVAVADGCYSPSFIPIFFSENVIGDSIALRAGDKNEQDRQGAYSQGTLSLLETALNKYSIWLIIRIYRFCKNKVWGEIPQLISFRIIKVIFYKRHVVKTWTIEH